MLCTCYTSGCCDVLYKKQTFHETDDKGMESSTETDAEELEEDDCQETVDLRSGINIEHCLNKEQAACDIRSDLFSNAARVATVIDKVKTILCREMSNLKIVKVITCYLIA